MRKLFISLAVFAAALVSCSKMEVSEVLPGEGNVEFTICTPGEMTRAATTIGDGENVDIVYYEIYKAEQNHKNSVVGGTPLIEGSTGIVGKEAVLSLNLLEDQEYVALFWAQVNGKKFYDVTDLRNVTALYTDDAGKAILSNNEDRAAFCQVHTFSTEASYKNTVELVRPLAQLNLGTTKESLKLDYPIALEKSKMIVQGVGTMFNVAQMKAGATSTNVVFDLASVPNQDLEVKSTLYAYAGMNYFFVPADESSVNVEYDIQTDAGTVNRVVTNVPVKTNFRTNIIGNLLTNETVLTVIVDESFAKPDPDIIAPVASTTEELAAAEAGSTIWLADNATIALPEQMNKDITIIGGEGSVLTTPKIVKMENFTIKNVKFVQTDNSKEYGAFRYIGYGTLENCQMEGMSGIYQGYSKEYQTGDITLKNCKIVASWAYAVNTGGKDGNIYIQDCELYGWNSFGHKGNVIITNTKFYSNGTYGKLRLYQQADVTGCTFYDGMSIDFANPYQGTIEGKTLTFTNCKKGDGTSIVSIVDMSCFNDSKPTLIIDGVQYDGTNI